MISEAILEPLEQWRSLVGSVRRSGSGSGVVEIPLLGSSPLIKSRGEGELFTTAAAAVSVPQLRIRAYLPTRGCVIPVPLLRVLRNLSDRNEHCRANPPPAAFASIRLA